MGTDKDSPDHLANPADEQSAVPKQGEEGSTDGVQFPNAVWPGMTLNWDSPLVPIQLHAELPFWLFIPDADLDVSVEGCTLRVTVTQNAVEIQQGKFYSSSHANLLHLERPPPSEKAIEIIKATKEGVTFRVARTLLTFQTRALDDAVKAFHESGRRGVDARMYFQALAYAHLHHLNKLINSYRSVASDPFAMRVAEWDVPLWFASFGDRMGVISLLPYASNDQYPVVLRKEGGPQPVQLASKEQVQVALNADVPPGQNELMDAWSLYYRGHYEDAIRSLVTAIEVVLEAKYREALAKKGLSEAAVEERAERTWNDFEGRLAEYLYAAARRIPGPLISLLPYINGVRLKIELESTRRLRHAIVHEGERLPFTLKGHLQRAMETTTWLYNWFIDDPTKSVQLAKNLGLKGAMLGHVVFDRELTGEGIAVKRLETEEFETLPSDPLVSQLYEAIDKETADVEKFGLMCFNRLQYSQGSDSPPPEHGSLFLHERCYLTHSNKIMVVFIIDTAELIRDDTLKDIAARVLVLKQQGVPFSSVMCLVNHQNGLPWQLREIDSAISANAIKMATLCGVTFVTTVDLLLLVVGAKTYHWDLDAIKSSLLEPGRQGTCPPEYVKVGVVHHFYERPQVVSVRLDPAAAATIEAGDTIVIRLRDRYFQHKVDSIEVNRVQVTQASNGQIAGIKTSLHRSDVTLEFPIYRQKRE